MNPAYSIRALARDDLKEIYQYGARNLGTTQASNYLDTLGDHFWNLTRQPKMGIEREELLPNIRSFPVESHVIFYRIQNTQVEIVRILHERQDPQRHMK